MADALRVPCTGPVHSDGGASPMAPAGADLEHGSGNRAGHRGVAADSEGTAGPLRGHGRRSPVRWATARNSPGSDMRSRAGLPRWAGRRTARRPRTAPLLHPWRRGPLAALPCISVVTSTTRAITELPAETRGYSILETPAPAIDRIVHHPVILEVRRVGLQAPTRPGGRTRQGGATITRAFAITLKSRP